VDGDESDFGEILDVRTDNEVYADDRFSNQFGQTESDAVMKNGHCVRK